MQIVPEAEEEVGYVDSIFGRGTWTRVTDGVFKYANEKPIPPHGFSCDVGIHTHVPFLVAGGPRTG